MAEQPAIVPDPRARIIQRCPNCEARADVSTFVAGALVRCARCAVRFNVDRPVAPERKKTPAPPLPSAQAWAPPESVRSPDPANVPAWPEVSAPRWDALGLANEKTIPSDSVRGAPPAIAPAPARPAVRLDPYPPPPQKRAAPDAAVRAPAVAPLPTAVQRAPPPSPPLPALEGFVVLERLGQGGMGEVFRCTRGRDARPVAVKVLSASLAVVPDYVKRFEREAAAMAQLDHPGIVRLLDRGRSGPHCWISMDLIDGVSLRTYAHQNRPSARLLAKLLSQVAHALAYAHARGVVHRDLKPDNVLVQPDLHTKVLDFGLAGLYVQGAECLTQSNVAMGTANYMAPEQRKDAKHVDHRADLYSFGVMLYELLTGELPVGRFPQPSKVVVGLSTEWDQLVERCLELEPSKRPHSALELAHALERLAGLSPAMELAPRTKRLAGRSGLWSWMGLGMGVVVVLGVVSLRIAQEHSTRRTISLPTVQLAGRTPPGRVIRR